MSMVRDGNLPTFTALPLNRVWHILSKCQWNEWPSCFSPPQMPGRSPCFPGDASRRIGLALHFTSVHRKPQKKNNNRASFLRSLSLFPSFRAIVLSPIPLFHRKGLPWDRGSWLVREPRWGSVCSHLHPVGLMLPSHKSRVWFASAQGWLPSSCPATSPLSSLSS